MDYGPVNCAFTFLYKDDKGNAVATCSNTYHIVSGQTEITPLLVETNNAILAGFDLLPFALGQYAFMVGCHYRPLGHSTFPDTYDEIGGNTGEYVEHAPFNQTLLVQKFVGEEWNTYRGRAYIPFIGKPLGGGPFVPGFDTDLQLIADQFAATLSDGSTTMTPIVYYKATDSFDTVVKCKISQFLAYQRRRNASRRYYEIP